ncbi:MAG: hypothetical protein R2755_04235 [Acidimicrobiales bacterium]
MDQPWVTAAETCECAPSTWPPATPSGRWRSTLSGRATAIPTAATTGRAWSTRCITFDGEHATYTAAAVVPTADARTGASPAAALYLAGTPPPPATSRSIDPGAGQRGTGA